jgi:general secretion pathway protein A
LRLVLAGLGVDAAGLDKAAMLGAIERGLHAVARTGRRTLLVLDEAQALPHASLEELRMLSNFQAGGYPLLQIFLLGQPEFRLVLAEPRLDQLRQRVIAMHHLEPMAGDEVEPYLIHRLSCVGWRGRPRFTNDALAAMHRWSGGSPRRLNQLASRVLLFGAVERKDTFGAPELAAVIADLDADAPGPRPAPVAEEPLELSELAPLAMTPRAAPAAPAPAPNRPAPRPVAAAPAPEAAGAEADRIARLERQLAEQDEALRRVLSLLVDWVEGDPAARPDLSRLRA